jgi:chemosensory pili system protein ChpA (sensor histidine kinase/response regulator)
MILIVDDHPDTREALVRLLQLNGHEANAVADGAQLLLFVQTHPPPALILLDVHMPHVDGIGVLRALRADPRLATLPVVVFSADERYRAAAMRLGAAAYILKGSLDWIKLSEQIDRLAGGSTKPAAPAPLAGDIPKAAGPERTA